CRAVLLPPRDLAAHRTRRGEEAYLARLTASIRYRSPGDGDMRGRCPWAPAAIRPGAACTRPGPSWILHLTRSEHMDRGCETSATRRVGPVTGRLGAATCAGDALGPCGHSPRRMRGCELALHGVFI